MALNDPELLKLVDFMDRIAVQYGKHKAIHAYPWLRFIAPKASGWAEMKTNIQLVLAFVEDTIRPYLARYNPEG